MNLKEAYIILELSPSASAEEVKKKYRELTKKYHPDVNKSPDAEDKFKKINEAHSVIQKGEDPAQPHGGFNVQDMLRNNKRRKRVEPQNVNLFTRLSFKEAIFGCKKDFVYDKINKCDECNGRGIYSLHNGCTECNGRGVIISQQGNMFIQQTCGKCRGVSPTEECKTCSATGGIKTTRTITVTIPGGVSNGNVLRLEGMGNFVEVVNNFFGSGEAYTDAFVHLGVQPPEFDCTIKNNNLHVTVNVSLLEALTGCSKLVDTLDGKKEIKVLEKTKNGQQVIISNLGVSRNGNQIVDINVEYPDDINSLIKFLLTKEN